MVAAAVLGLVFSYSLFFFLYRASLFAQHFSESTTEVNYHQHKKKKKVKQVSRRRGSAKVGSTEHSWCLHLFLCTSLGFFFFVVVAALFLHSLPLFFFFSFLSLFHLCLEWISSTPHRT